MQKGKYENLYLLIKNTIYLSIYVNLGSASELL